MILLLLASDSGLSFLKDLGLGLFTVFIVMEMLFTAIRYKDIRKSENRAQRRG